MRTTNDRPSQKTASTQVMIEENRERITPKYLEYLRKRMDISEAFLKNAKQDVQIMKDILQEREDAILGRTSFSSMDRSADNIKDIMNSMDEKLNKLRVRLHNLKSKPVSKQTKVIKDVKPEIEIKKNNLSNNEACQGENIAVDS